jgi:hypothetical protein
MTDKFYAVRIMYDGYPNLLTFAVKSEEDVKRLAELGPSNGFVVRGWNVDTVLSWDEVMTEMAQVDMNC